jgi:hypothetical protein
MASPARADDVLHLKDGRVLEGQVVREIDGHVFFRYELAGIEQETLFSPAQIESLERDAAVATEPAVASKQEPVKQRARKPGVPRIAVLTLGEGTEKDMVGVYITAKTLEDMIPLLEEEGVTDVVFHVNSGGGLVLEIQRLSDVIHNEYKPRFRTVAWIESAISAAAMTSHCLEEIYFKPEGNYGACTGWSGQLVAMKGRGLEELLYAAEKISARGNHDYRIMRAMEILDAPLSCTIDDDTGEVTWYQDTSGEIVVNTADRILTFDAPTAERVKFSKGTAATIDELAHLMGYEEVEWVGEPDPEYQWPVSKAEAYQIKFRDKTEEDQRRTQEYFVTYQQAVGIAQGTQDREDRAKFVNRARKALTQIDRMIQNNPNLSFLVMGMLPRQYEEWLLQQRQLLRDLMK